MGIDVRIAVEWKGDGEPPSPDYAIEGELAEGSSVEGATHELNSMTRYYGQHYERGPWPYIGAYLLQLVSMPGIARVWYGSDDDSPMEEVTFEWWCQMSRHYWDNGERPYRKRVPRIKRKISVTLVK